MIVTPGGPYAVADLDGLLRCFDDTAASTFAFICRLVGGDRAAAERLLADVYSRIVNEPGGAAPSIVDARGLHARAVAAAVELADGRQGGGSDVRERALIDLGIVAQRSIEEIGAIVGLSSVDVAARIEALRQQYGSSDEADRSLRASELWLDDESRDRVRLALASGSTFNANSGIVRPATDVARWQAPSVRWNDRSRDEPPVSTLSGERRSSTRLKVGAALGIAVVFAAGFFWVTPSGDDSPDDAKRADDAVDATVATSDTAAPETSERVTTTTDADDGAPTTTVDPYVRSGLQLSPGYILATIPAGFEPAGLSEATADQDAGPSAGAWFQLWAEPAATRTTGRWLAMSTTTRAASNELDSATVKQRFSGLGYSGLRRIAPDGVVEMTVTVGSDPTRTVAMASFGLSEAELVSIATSLEPFAPTGGDPGVNRGARLQPSSVGMAVLHGMEVIEAGPTFCCGIHAAGPPADQRWVYYANVSDPSGSSFISVGTADSLQRSQLERFVDQTGMNRDNTSMEQVVQVGDRLVHVTGGSSGIPDGTSDYSSAWWSEQNQRITVTGSVEAADLVVLIGSVRLATEEEWLDVREHSFSGTSVTSGDFELPVRQSIGDVEIDDQLTFSLIVEPDSNTAEIDQGQSGSVFNWSSADVISEYSSTTATVLIISVPDQPPGTRARVTVAGREPTLVDLVPLDGRDGSVGFDAFTQLPPYTVELVDAAGNVTQLLTP